MSGFSALKSAQIFSSALQHRRLRLLGSRMTGALRQMNRLQLLQWFASAAASDFSAAALVSAGLEPPEQPPNAIAEATKQADDASTSFFFMITPPFCSH